MTQMRMFLALVPAIGLAACVQAPRYAATQQAWPTQPFWPGAYSVRPPVQPTYVMPTDGEEWVQTSACSTETRNGHLVEVAIPGTGLPCIHDKGPHYFPDDTHYPGALPHGWNAVPLGNGNWRLYN